MTTSMTILLLVLVVGLIALQLSWLAGRLDRHHARAEASAAVLDAELLRRSGAALDLATAAVLDPAASMIVADSASRARTSEPELREQAESELTEVLGAALGDPAHVAVLSEDPAAAQSLRELGGACRRVAHAHRFHNGNVSTVRRLRAMRTVRLLHLAGHAAMPETVEFDDVVPRGLPG